MGTFSIVARCPETSALGVCVSTAVPAVGSVVPHAEAGVGAIATQAHTNILYGTGGLKLLKMGFTPQVTLDAMLSKDPDRQLRQVIIIDKAGRKAAYTGRETVEWKGHISERDCVAAGNMLTSDRVIEAMIETFECSEGWLADRLMRSLEAGGDKRGKVSAALLVVGEGRLPKNRPFISLRVDFHEEPVKELRRIFEAYKRWINIQFP